MNLCLALVKSDSLYVFASETGLESSHEDILTDRQIACFLMEGVKLVLNNEEAKVMVVYHATSQNVRGDDPS